MPFGISSAPEEFQRRLQGVLHGLEGVAVVADETLVFGVGVTEAMGKAGPRSETVQTASEGAGSQFKVQ